MTEDIADYVYFRWAPYCDYPNTHQVPMIYSDDDFYTNTVAMDALFNGPCNDSRPLLFLNEPAQLGQANVSPEQAADMFYEMTRGSSWPRARWRGHIYVGNNLIEDQAWDTAFVNAFAAEYNNDDTQIPEVAGWGVHLYGNFEYGPYAGDPSQAWFLDIPATEIPGAVARSTALVEQYQNARGAEGNSTELVVTEFGLLQCSIWHNPPTFLYTTTSKFLEEYVFSFDENPNIRSWFWYKSTGADGALYDTDYLFKADGSLTPNGTKWREMAGERHNGGY